MTDAEPKKTAVYRKESDDLWAFVFDFEVTGAEVVMVDVRSDSPLRPRQFWKLHAHSRRQECVDLIAKEKEKIEKEKISGHPWWPNSYIYALDEQVFDVPDALSAHTQAFAAGDMTPGIYAEALQDYWPDAPEAVLTLLRRPYNEAN